MKKRLLIPGLILILFLTGCNTVDSTQHITTEHSHSSEVEVISTETTSGPTVLPTFLNQVDPAISFAYQVAANHQNVLEYIPCYCGCGESEGHINNLDCFIKEVKPDGSIVWDVHAVTCGNCQEIAKESAILKNQGKGLKEIRQFIDTKYKEGFAKPTPTPLPAD